MLCCKKNCVFEFLNGNERDEKVNWDLYGKLFLDVNYMDA